MSNKKFLCLALMLALLTGTANSEDGERGAILALMDKAFEVVGPMIQMICVRFS